MKYKYYNKEDFEYITSFLDTNPYLARKKIEEYMSEHEKDYYVLSHYIYSLIILGEFEEAEEKLNEFESLVDNSKYLNRNSDALNKVKAKLILSRMNLMMRQEKYKELYDYYQRNYCLIKRLLDIEIDPFMFYCKKMLGLLDDSRRDEHPYIFRQIVSYSESDFLEHIKKHLFIENVNATLKNPCIFNEDFPLDDMVKEISSIIPTDGDGRLYYNFYVCVYVFRYDNCGKVNGKSVNYFKAVCFQNTNHFITMYPSDNCKDLPYIDLNYLALSNSTSYAKKMLPSSFNSRIDRFNRRFGFNS